jgi:hypothetical protein
MRKRYPDETPAAAAAPAKPPAPQKESAKPDKTPTGSIAARASR